MDLKNRVALRVKTIRKLRGLSQEALAALVSRSPDAISNLERAISLPAIDTLEALAVGLGVPIAELISETAAETGKRVGLMARLTDTARRLDDGALLAAVEIVEVLAKTR